MEFGFIHSGGRSRASSRDVNAAKVVGAAQEGSDGDRENGDDDATQTVPSMILRTLRQRLHAIETVVMSSSDHGFTPLPAKTKQPKVMVLDLSHQSMLLG